MPSLSDSTLAFLASRGAESIGADARNTDSARIVRALEQAYPADRPSLRKESTAAYLAALTDCLIHLNEQIYEYYRPLVDLFRRLVFALRADPDSAGPAWEDALRAGDRLGFFDASELCPVPHKN